MLLLTFYFGSTKKGWKWYNISNSTALQSFLFPGEISRVLHDSFRGKTSFHLSVENFPKN